MSHSKFLDQPEDTMIHIHSFCDIRDLISLRCVIQFSSGSRSHILNNHILKCCKQLERISRQRSIWVNALGNFISLMRLHRPSFPMHTFSALQLEHSATQALRLYSMCKRIQLTEDHGSVLSASIERTFMIESDGYQDVFGPMPDRILDTRFVSGGRFLCVLSELSLQLWDLHNDPSHIIGDEPLAFVTLDQDVRISKRNLYIDNDAEGRVCAGFLFWRLLSAQTIWCRSFG